jgi:hypothetical protein
MGDRLSPVFFRAHPTAIAVPFLLLRLVIARLSNNFIAPTGCQPVLVKMVVKTSPEAPVMSPVSPHGLKTRDTLSASLAVEQQHQAPVDLVELPFLAAEV